MKTSEQGRVYIRGHEGTVLTCYLDPTGHPTIGTGATLYSRVAREFFGGKLVPGKTKITLAQADQLFAAMLAEEYEPHVARGMPGANQHEFDAGADNCYNMGPGTFGWNWAKLWRAGKKREAAKYLEAHYHKSKGKVLAGLVRRREETAQILLHGKYPKHAGEGAPRKQRAKPTSTPDPVIKEAQELLTSRGFNPGAIDGWMGKKTKAALLAYQQAHPHLVNDGILGAATLTQLRRDAQMAGQVAKDAVTKGGGGSIIGGALAFTAGLPWGWIVAAIVVGAIGWGLWRYRDVLARRLNSIQGIKVEV
ncbi:glycoside hydrolase family protein [Maritalea porphyrae]|uniref:glycoside hydrolase family protein n=1 Tax=Maritalea porphyrae TaxID=880732 RepID=UPI0022AF6077|nr:peptidoglycan-binding protein [Maritalea porphyrae]MCZ4272472.1 peptidoglycan-binding protein [Maritalea porphyrae]